MRMFAMEHRGELRAKQQDQAGDITPGQHCHYRANRSVNLRCESDDHVTCMSEIIEGLGYITGNDENCKFPVVPGVTSVPPCAKIEGFEILAKNRPHSR